MVLTLAVTAVLGSHDYQKCSQTDRQAVSQTDRQTDRVMDRQIGECCCNTGITDAVGTDTSSCDSHDGADRLMHRQTYECTYCLHSANGVDVSSCDSRHSGGQGFC